ncbi:TolC family protein [Engelhardtia mirabilis]|uniref:Outer membrane protein TolC n=1 Tax=Engelhardtia mirabilis TaxID=2528011 RepID=A0A518BKR2_9BACT|nr:Outer membrane protein TolC precursor [Planctomycetes bacterium Pla133]QDV01890.1 Outer membrane protein TolC precursor [Planctomycetes bacterium Pla86]
MSTPPARRTVPAFLLLLLSLAPAGRAAVQETEAPADASSAGVTPEEPPKSAPGTSLQLTLGDALRIAVAENLSLALEDETVEQALASSLGSWGAFDPVLDLAASYTDSDQPQANTFIAAGASAIADQVTSIGADLVLPVTTGGSFRVGFDESLTETNNPGIVGDPMFPGPFPDGDYTNASLSAGFTQPLLRGAWSRTATADQRQSEISLRRAEAGRRVTRDDLVANVSNAYWDLVAAREEEQVRVLALELAQEQLSQNGERLRVGVGTEVDVLQAETQVAQEEERLLRARTDVQARSDGLKALLLRRGEASDDAWDAYLDLWTIPIEPLTSLPVVEGAAEVAPWREILEQALERRPELIQALLDVDAAQVELDRAESSRLPGLDLNLDARSVSIEDEPAGAFKTASQLDFMTYTGSLNFNLPLRNRTARYAERAARSRLRAARLSFEQVEATVVSEIRNAVREVEYQAQAVLAARKSREFTARQLQAEQARYEEGLATTFQVLEFQQQLAAALSTEQASLSAYAKSRVALAKATGQISDALGSIDQN